MKLLASQPFKEQKEIVPEGIPQGSTLEAIDTTKAELSKDQRRWRAEEASL